MNLKTFAPYRLILSLGTHGFLNWIPDKTYLSILYFLRMGKSMNWKDPQRYTEKLQWLKVFDRQPAYTMMVDKYHVREYVSNIIGDEYLVPLVGHYQKYEEIDFSKLPNQFILKCTHGSHCSLICKEKKDFPIVEGKKQMRKWLKHNYYWAYREWPYKNVIPTIICEKLLIDDEGEIPDDYKVFCFNGKARFVKLDVDRFSNHHRVFYDIEWNRYEHGWGVVSDTDIPKPSLLNLMIHNSEELAKGLPQARVDWYVCKDQLFFGEITFFDAGGLEPFNNPQNDIVVGNLLCIKNENN